MEQHNLRVEQEAERVRIREEFPTFNKSTAVYMDNAGGSLLPAQVLQAVEDHCVGYCVQPGVHDEGKAVVAARDGGRRWVADILGCGVGESVVGSSSRAIVNMVVKELGGKKVNIVLCENNHVTHLESFESVPGAVVRYLPVDINGGKPGFVDPEALHPILRGLDHSRPTIVVVAHVSNLIGEVVPLHPITAICRQYSNTYAFVDGVAYSSSACPDISSSPDFYTISLYKMMCPQSGAMYISHRARAMLNLSNDMRFTSFEHACGGTNWPALSGTLGMRQYLKKVLKEQHNGTDRDLVMKAYDKMYSLVTPLGLKLRKFVDSHPNAVLLATPGYEKWCKPIVSFTTEGVAPKEVVEHLAKGRVVCKNGDMMSPRMARALGLSSQGAVRLSVAHYNTESEVDYVISLLQEVLGTPSKL